MLYRTLFAATVVLACSHLLGAQSVNKAHDHAHAATATTLPVITIHAHRFAFDPPQITLKKGKPVELDLISDDVHHSLVVGGLSIHADMLPGTTTHVKVTPYDTGDFTGDCGHFCGMGHNKMHLVIHVVNP